MLEVEKNWKEQRESKLYSDYILGENDIHFMNGRGELEERLIPKDLFLLWVDDHMSSDLLVSKNVALFQNTAHSSNKLNSAF